MGVTNNYLQAGMTLQLQHGTAIFAYICHKDQPNVAKDAIHGCYGIGYDFKKFNMAIQNCHIYPYFKGAAFSKPPVSWSICVESMDYLIFMISM